MGTPDAPSAMPCVRGCHSETQWSLIGHMFPKDAATRPFPGKCSSKRKRWGASTGSKASEWHRVSSATTAGHSPDQLCKPGVLPVSIPNMYKSLYYYKTHWCLWENVRPYIICSPCVLAKFPMILLDFQNQDSGQSSMMTNNIALKLCCALLSIALSYILFFNIYKSQRDCCFFDWVQNRVYIKKKKPWGKLE